MNLDNLNLVELNAQQVELINGGNGIHSGGTGLATGNGSEGLKILIHAASDFVRGFFS